LLHTRIMDGGWPCTALVCKHTDSIILHTACTYTYMHLLLSLTMSSLQPPTSSQLLCGGLDRRGGGRTGRDTWLSAGTPASCALCMPPLVSVLRWRLPHLLSTAPAPRAFYWWAGMLWPLVLPVLFGKRRGGRRKASSLAGRQRHRRKSWARADAFAFISDAATGDTAFPPHRAAYYLHNADLSMFLFGALRRCFARRRRRATVPRG